MYNLSSTHLALTEQSTTWVPENLDADFEDPYEEEFFASPSTREQQQPPKQNHPGRGQYSFWDVLSFGICVAAANIFIDWSEGFQNGFWDFFLTNIVSSVTFICLYCCIAEMVSILPFSGGMYGFARVTCTPYIGYLVGCFESIGNIVYVMVAMFPIGQKITFMTGWEAKYEPIYWFLAYALAIGTECAGRRFFFWFLRGYALLTVILVLMYVAISIPAVHPHKYIPVNEEAKESMFVHGLPDMMHLLPMAGYYYYGIEIIPLVSDEIQETRRNTPLAIIWTIVFVTIFSFLCMFLAFAQYPSFKDDYDLHHVTQLPLNSGFSNAFGIKDQLATIFSYPALYISNALFIYGYGKQLCALAKSKLFPAIFAWTLPDSNVPYMALIIGSLVSYGLLLLLSQAFQQDYNTFFIDSLFNSALLGSYVTFAIMFFSYLQFYYYYPTLPRAIHNPLGVSSAIVGLIGLGFLIASLVVTPDIYCSPVVNLILFVLMVSVYYFCVARHQQIFSDDEQTVMFTVYLLKENRRKQKSRTDSGHLQTVVSSQTDPHARPPSDSSVNEVSDFQQFASQPAPGPGPGPGERRRELKRSNSNSKMRVSPRGLVKQKSSRVMAFDPTIHEQEEVEKEEEEAEEDEERPSFHNRVKAHGLALSHQSPSIPLMEIE